MFVLLSRWGLLWLAAGLFARLDARPGRVTAVAEAIGLIARLDDVAVMRQAVYSQSRMAAKDTPA